MTRNLFVGMLLMLILIAQAATASMVGTDSVQGLHGNLSILGMSNQSLMTFYNNGTVCFGINSSCATSWSIGSLINTANGTGNASTGYCPSGYAVQNVTNTSVQCILLSSADVTFAQLDAVNQSKLNVTDQRYNESLLVTLVNDSLLAVNNSLSNKLNVNDQRYNETGLFQSLNLTKLDTSVFNAENVSLWSVISNKLNIADQRYNDTLLIQFVNSSLISSLNNYLLVSIFTAENISLWSVINGKLSLGDQRYNETQLVNAVNASVSLKLDAVDQRYNDTPLISTVNITIWNYLEGLLLNTTFGAENVSIWSAIGALNVTIGQKLDTVDQRYNDTTIVNAVNDTVQNKLDTTDQRYNDTLLILSVNQSFIDENMSIWNALNNKLDIIDQRYNDTGMIVIVNDSLNSVNASLIDKLDVTDQRYNETPLIDAVNSSVQNKLDTTDQRYNETILVDTLNQSFFAENMTVWSAINNKLDTIDQRYNDTFVIESLNQSFVAENMSVWFAINNKLDTVDQRYNDTILVGIVNTSISIELATKLNISDQRYNESVRIDDILFRQQNLYAGFKQLPSYTDNLDGTITFGVSSVALYNNTDWQGRVQQYNLTNGTTGFGSVVAIPDGTTSYLVAEYNAGNPQIQVTTNRDLIHQSDVVPFLSVTRTGNELYILSWNHMGNGMPERLNDRLVRTERFARETGLVPGVGANQTFTVTSGVLWYGTTRLLLDAADTGVSGIDEWIHNSTGQYIKNDIPSGQWNNTYYDNETGPVELTNGTYAIRWLYRNVETPQEVDYVVGHAQYNSISEARQGQPPETLPFGVSANYILVGRLIFQKYATTGDVGSSWVTSFSDTAAIAHNDLSGIQGGANGEFYHLTAAEYNQINTNQWMNITDQRFNETSLIQSLNTTKAGVGSCPDGYLVQNTTTNGVQCLFDNDTMYAQNGSSVNFTEAQIDGFVINSSGFNKRIGSTYQFGFNDNVFFNQFLIGNANTTVWLFDMYANGAELAFQTLGAAKGPTSFGNSGVFSNLDGVSPLGNSTRRWGSLFVNNINFNGTMTGNVNASVVMNVYWLNTTDQRYNDTLLIGTVNVSAQSKAIPASCVDGTVLQNTTTSGNPGCFNVTNEALVVNTFKLNETDQRYNDTALVQLLNTTKARIGSCPTGYEVQNTTISGVECIAESSVSTKNVTFVNSLKTSNTVFSGTILSLSLPGNKSGIITCSLFVNTSATANAIYINTSYTKTLTQDTSFLFMNTASASGVCSTSAKDYVCSPAGSAGPAVVIYTIKSFYTINQTAGTFNISFRPENNNQAAEIRQGSSCTIDFVS